VKVFFALCTFLDDSLHWLPQRLPVILSEYVAMLYLHSLKYLIIAPLNLPSYNTICGIVNIATSVIRLYWFWVCFVMYYIAIFSLIYTYLALPYRKLFLIYKILQHFLACQFLVINDIFINYQFILLVIFDIFNVLIIKVTLLRWICIHMNMYINSYVYTNMYFA